MALPGSPLSFQFREDYSDQIIGVTVGTLDNPGDFPPTRHNWTSDQLAWLDIEDDLPRNPGDAGVETGACPMTPASCFTPRLPGRTEFVPMKWIHI